MMISTLFTAIVKYLDIPYPIIKIEAIDATPDGLFFYVCYSNTMRYYVIEKNGELISKHNNSITAYDEWSDLT
jgi:hypothetical protein